MAQNKIKVGDTVVRSTNQKMTWKQHRERYKIVTKIYNRCGYPNSEYREDDCPYENEEECKSCKHTIQVAILDDKTHRDLSELEFFM